MVRKEQVLTVFVASPSDVASERARLEEVITELNQAWSRLLGIRLDLVLWETHAYPSFGADAQEVINRQIPEDFDIFIGIMWYRFGTPTGRAESGTLEEFQRAKVRWDKDSSAVTLMIYFKESSPLSLRQIDPAQLGKVMEFRKSLGDEGGLYWPFQTTEDFVNLARIHLTRVVQEWCHRLSTPDNSKKTSPSTNVLAKSSNAEELGVFELSEKIEVNFAKATKVMTRITKSTSDIGAKMLEHTRRMEAAKSGGQLTRQGAKRLITMAAKDMTAYADKLDREVPSLGDLMDTGLGAMSQAISYTPNAQHEHVQTWITAIQGFRNILVSVDAKIDGFRLAIVSLPSLTRELNQAKRSVATSLQKLLDLLRAQHQNLIQTEKAASDLIKI